tara:strand:- start:126 stop:320 length:195 start_codon:yes stop_codon:yes gene_type:complete
MGSRFWSERHVTKGKPRGRATRPKTFTSEEKAKEWALKKGIKKYVLKNMKSPEAKVKKIKVVAQ